MFQPCVSKRDDLRKKHLHQAAEWIPLRCARLAETDD